MNQLTHPYFGTLAIIPDDDVIWEGEVYLANSEKLTEIWLWLYSDDKEKLFTKDNLDNCAKVCQNLDNWHQKSQKYLLDYLENNPDFIADYADNITEYDLPELNKLIQNNQLSPQSFAPLLHLHKASIWLSDDFRIVEDGENHQVVLDYMIDPEQSDQILAVKFDLDGNFIAVAWES